MALWSRADEAHLFGFAEFGLNDLITGASQWRDRVTRDRAFVRQIEENRRLEFRAVGLIDEEFARSAGAESAFNEHGANALDEGCLFVARYCV